MLSREALIDTVHAGDCLEVMADWPDGLADLCYVALPSPEEWRWDAAAARRLDRIQRQARNLGHDTVLGLHIALGDVGTIAYLAFVAERLPALKRVLKPTGSLCVVGDTHAGHYAKVLLDAFFGASNLRGEIIWGPCGTEPEQIDSHHSATWYANDDAHRTDRPTPVVIVAADGTQGGSGGALALAKRVIAATTDHGDVVLDPFCGDALAASAARELGRSAIAIDASAKAHSAGREVGAPLRAGARTSTFASRRPRT
ncbi:MAG: site-specific DNA-methyltransferase [Gammaproteobacteria bacterium]|nr:site-specific DNA-methyltransferase [Gammaproteobacteria bacterium]